VSPKGSVKIRVLFVDEGHYHHETLRVPSAALDGYERLIDGLREDPAVLKAVYVDVERLCAAWVVDDD
jgi:hypothetical protein